ncbi:MAG TPA: lipid-binding SYLF domain-containing protein [Candidatus Angelobacter sp.]|jgi:lipid-binding SYLF domain-containing protein|nr:lipid-binding SYLF domain-containing protein [Candidatus Angelobacter sp.]
MIKSRVALLILCLGSIAWAQTATNTEQAKTDENANVNVSELQRSADVIKDMTALAPDKGVPKEVLSGAKCVAVIPKLVKGAFMIGGEHGKGVATCRTSSGWSAPAPFELSGISFGPQIGGKSSDIVMFIMNDEGAKGLMAGHIKVGADVSAVAGPVGRTASADAGWKAGILTYSSGKGVFIGASLNGAEIHQDNKRTEDWYGSKVSFKDILMGEAPVPNAAARAFVNAVQNAKLSAQGS